MAVGATDDDSDSGPVYNRIAVSTGVPVSVGMEISLVNTAATCAACHTEEAAAAAAAGALMLWPKELQRETAKSMVAAICGGMLVTQ